MIYKVAEHFILFMFYGILCLFFPQTRRRAVYLYIKKKKEQEPLQHTPIHDTCLVIEILCCSWNLSFLVRFRALFGAACHVMLNSCSQFGAACLIVLTLLVGLYDFAGQCLDSAMWSSPGYWLLRVWMVVLIRWPPFLRNKCLTSSALSNSWYWVSSLKI